MGKRKGRRRQPRLEALESRRLLTSVTEFPLSSANADPTSITRGADGNIWFTELHSGAIGMISPGDSTHTIQTFTLGSGIPAAPSSITAGPDGNIWFTETNGLVPEIGRITTDSSHTVTTYGPPQGLTETQWIPYAITTGPNASGTAQVLWFTDSKTGKLGMIDPSNPSNVPAEISLPNTMLGFAGFQSQITAGPGGSIWFTEASPSGGPFTSSAIGVYYPKTGTFNQVMLPSTSGVQLPNGIALGPDGNIWFTESVSGNANASAIGVINLTGSDAVTELPAGANAQPTGITAGPDGDLWYTDAGNTAIGSVNINSTTDPTKDTLGTLTPVPPSTQITNPNPNAITMGPDGNLWFVGGSAVNSSGVGAVTLDTKLVVTTPTGVTAGSPFGLTVQDEYADTGAPDTAYNGGITVSLASGPSGGNLGGTTSLSAVKGVASFSGLTLSSAGSYTLTAIGGNGLTATTNAFNVAATPTPTPTTPTPTPTTPTPTPTTPTIVAEQIELVYLKHNKKGKPVVDIVFQFSTAMNPGTAGSTSNYQVGWISTKKVKKKLVQVVHPVSVLSVTPNSSDTAFTVATSATQKTFAKGGQVVVIGTASSGVSSTAGVFLGGNPTFTISAKAGGIS